MRGCLQVAAKEQELVEAQHNATAAAAAAGTAAAQREAELVAEVQAREHDLAVQRQTLEGSVRGEDRAFASLLANVTVFMRQF